MRVNGKEVLLERESTVLEFLESKSLSVERVVVEVNKEILDKKEFINRTLKEGDEVEIVAFVGGG